MNVKKGKVCVITIALSHNDELKAFLSRMKKQTYKNVEIVYELGGTIVDAYRRALIKAKQTDAEYFLFTETDIVPQDTWVADMVALQPKKDEVIRGTEMPVGFSVASTIARREAYDGVDIDPQIKITVDTDLGMQLASKGRNLLTTPKVVYRNIGGEGSYVRFKRSFNFGRDYAVLNRRHKKPFFPFVKENILAPPISAMLRVAGALWGVAYYYLIYNLKKHNQKR